MKAVEGGHPLPTAHSDPYHESVLRFVEQFALLLSDGGMPRMPARVFAFVLADDAERYTAKELADGLRVSPAAISGAVNYLVHAGLLGREREPGARKDSYRVYDDDVWSAITRQRQQVLERWVTFLAEGVDLLDQARPGARRIRETLEYYRFMCAEIPQMMQRWDARRRELFPDTPKSQG